MKKAAIVVVLLVLAVSVWTVGVNGSEGIEFAAAIEPPPTPAAVANKGVRRFFSPDELAPPANLLSSRGQEIDKLVARGRPEDALAAFHIAEQCRAARAWERGYREMPPPVHSVESACAGIMQRHLMDMPRLLRLAVKARVKGAGVAQYRFGPLGGDVSALLTRPGDPAVVEWQTSTRLALIEEARRNGDREVVADLSYSYADGSLGEKNPELSLAYLLAYLELRLRIPGTRATHDASLIAQASRDLTPEQVNAARDFARKLIDECCPRI